MNPGQHQVVAGSCSCWQLLAAADWPYPAPVSRTASLLAVLVLASCTTGEATRGSGHVEAQPAPAAAEPERPPLVTVELSLVDDAAREQLATRLGPDSPVQAGALLAVHHHIADGWHIYWRNPGESGLRTRVDISATGARAGELLYPAPEQFESAGQVTYGWGHDVVLFIPLADISDDATLALTSSYLACAESCIPGETKLEVRVANLQLRNDAIVRDMLARVPEPAGARVSGSWVDGALQLRPTIDGLRLDACFPYLHDTALLGHQSPRDGGLELHYRFTGAPPTDAAQGVLRVDLDGQPRWLELAVAWPRS